MFDLPELRKLIMLDALKQSFVGGQLQAQPSVQAGFPHFRRELDYADLCALEYADEQGGFFGDERARDAAMACLQRAAGCFGRDGTVMGGAGPGPFFALVPFTSALLALRGRVDEHWHTRMIDAAVQLVAGMHQIDRTHEYLNARALEALSILQLHELSGDACHMQRSQECLDNLVARIYPCGAQMYHSGTWVWGRRPAQVYQFLSAILMLQCGLKLQRTDVVDYVRRIMDYSLLATDRQGQAFISLFEGLHKCNLNFCAGRQWVICTALGDAKYHPLARSTYPLWQSLLFDEQGRRRHDRERFAVEELCDAMRLGIRHAPLTGPTFQPSAGQFALEDISTVFVHEPDLDLGMTVLTGYSGFVEGDFGNVKLYALTPELTDQPTYANAGTDALRGDWHKPSEQIDCSADGGRAHVSGWTYTKWDKVGSGGKDFSRLHNRRLEVSMTYQDRELLFEYRTVKTWQKQPVPSRLLLLLSVRPTSASPIVHIGDARFTPPPAESSQTFFQSAPVAPVRFAAPDGCAIEIIPELSLAEAVTLERPERVRATEDRRAKVVRKPANDGTLRIAFEGPNVLDEGRYRIRFIERG